MSARVRLDGRTLLRRLAGIAVGEPYPDVTATAPTPEELRSLPGTWRAPDGTLRRVRSGNGTLSVQRGDRSPSSLQMSATRHLHFVPDELSYFAPIRDADGNVLALDYYENGDGPPVALQRVEADVR